MKVKEFLKLIDLESMNNQGITIIIPIDELHNETIKNIGDCTIDVQEKIVIDSSEYAKNDYELYDQYGIEPCFKSENEEDEDYEIIDVKESEDFYNYVYNEYGEVWVVVN